MLETGERKWLAVGVVYEGYHNSQMPGWRNESVGYHTDDGKIFHNSGDVGYDTCQRNGPMACIDDGYVRSGLAMARRGDRIRCTVMLDKKRESDGKVPVLFTLNGSRIIIFNSNKCTEYKIFMDPGKSLYPYIGMTDGCSVLAKMLPSENVNYRRSQLHEVKHDIAEVAKGIKTDIVEVRNEMKADIAGVRKDLEVIVSRKVETLMTSLEAKLDAVLAKPSEK